MPARRDLTLEEYAARAARQRELARLRMARLRARLRALREPVRVTREVLRAPLPLPGTPDQPRDANPPTPPVRESSFEEIEKIGALLAPFTERGYVHSTRFWHLAAAQYPALCLELEALKIADWLLEPRNAKRKCRKPFLDNWLQEAERRRLERPAPAKGGAATPPPPRPRPDPDQAPLFPAGHTLERIPPTERDEVLAARAAVPLQDKLAAILNGHAKGGLP